MLETVPVQLESIGHDLGEVGQLRADMQKLSGRINELAAVMAGQGQVPAEDAASAMPEHDPKPKRTSRKRRTTRARRPAEVGSTSDQDRSSIGEGEVAGHGRDPGGAVLPSVAVQTQAPLRSEDEAPLNKPIKLPRRVARSSGKAEVRRESKAPTS